MQSKNEILNHLKHCATKRLTVRLKLRHEHTNLLAVVEEIRNNDIVIVKPLSSNVVNSAMRTTFYIQEIEQIEIRTFFSNALLYTKLQDLKLHIRSLQAKVLTTQRLHAEA